MTTIKMKYLGTNLYRGYDEARKVLVVAFPNSTHDLSPAKADQLLRDFPKGWTLAPAAPGEPPAPVLPESKVQEIQERAPEESPTHLIRESGAEAAPKVAPKKKAGGRR